MKKRFNPIKDKSSEIIEYLMASPDMPTDEALCFKIRLSVEEAVENVVRYAYEGGIGWLEAGTSLDKDSLVLTIELRDAGVPFNPLDREDPDITPLGRGTRGGRTRHLPLQADDGQPQLPLRGRQQHPHNDQENKRIIDVSP